MQTTNSQELRAVAASQPTPTNHVENFNLKRNFSNQQTDFSEVESALNFIHADVRDTWQERLQMLCNRFSHLGIGADIAALTLDEAWGLYRFLLRLTDG